MANRKRLNPQLFAPGGLPCRDAAETIAFGKSFASALERGDVLSLEGPLGAGKTHFMKGLVLGLGLDDPVSSPTFTLLHEYGGYPLVYHFDFYRMESSEELYAIGFEDCLGEGIIVAEWGGKFLDALPAGTLRLHIEIGSGTNRAFRASWKE